MRLPPPGEVANPLPYLADGGIGVPEEEARHLVVLRVWVTVERHELVHEGPLLQMSEIIEYMSQGIDW